MANRWVKSGNSDRFYFLELNDIFYFLELKITVDGDCSHEIKRCLLLGRIAITNLDSILKKQRYHFANRGPCSQSYGFSSNHVWMWVLDHKEDWMRKSWYFWIVVLEKTPESPLDSKEIKSVNSKRNQGYIFTGRTELKLQYKELRRADSLERTLILGKIEGRRKGQ